MAFVISTKTRNQMKRIVCGKATRKTLRGLLHDDDRAWRCHAYAELLRRKHLAGQQVG